ncbi:5-methylaminomethyl-2-thiouridylate methyltransferase [Syncephalis fuscata]|nr:5-methylaminomethyl-2-thiouridylate methyltransferase [Syncephalis fuscata]
MLRIPRLAAVAGKRVVLGMSGGVDSSVAAFLLKQHGAHVEGVFMKNWDNIEEGGECPGERDWRDVQTVCRQLSIPCRQMNFVKEYWTRVFMQTLDDYAAGITPNPDIACNREIKFGVLLDRCVLKNNWFATGHYARIGYDAQKQAHLLKGIDSSKDQSYYLSGVSRTQLQQVIFPLGDLTKKQIRSIARENRLSTAEKDESMGICFVGQRRKFNQFLGEYLPQTPGPVIAPTDNLLVIYVICSITVIYNYILLGTHQGIFSWTIGQRATICYGNEKWFVSRKDITKNQIFVVPGTHHPNLFSSTIQVGHWQWIQQSCPDVIKQGGLVEAKIRYQQAIAEKCYIEVGNNDQAKVYFIQPVRAPAPGQFIVVYQGEECLGCGIIQSATP